jgi:hypothetical protein
MPLKKYTPKSGAVNGTITGILLILQELSVLQVVLHLEQSSLSTMVDQLNY